MSKRERGGRESVYKNSHVIGLMSVCVCVYKRIMGVRGFKKVGELKKDNRKKKKLLLGDRETQKQRDREIQRRKDRQTNRQRDENTKETDRKANRWT
jgi:hypothetical protein